MKERSVLIVDDDVAQRLFLTFDLEYFSVIEAGGVGEGYAAALSLSPDVVVIDRRLPDGDGLDLVRRLRRNPKTVQMPIAVMTAGFDEDDRREVMRSGADLYLAKPLEVGRMEASLIEMLALDPSELRPRRVDEMARIKAGLAPAESLVDLRDRSNSRRSWRRHVTRT